MPFHLSPVRSSRRRFLSTLAAGGAALGLGGRRADGADGPTGEWVALVSDTHIAADPGRSARGQLMAANLGEVVLDILGAKTKPAAMVIDGDLALLDGQAGDYATLIALIEPVRRAGVPIHLLLGNHDDRDRFRATLKGAIPKPSRVESKHLGAFEAAGHRFVLLDSLDKTNVTPGLLGPEQLAWLAADLDAAKALPSVVLVHHNPDAKTHSGLVDDDALLAVLGPRTWVKALVFGHTHTWSRAESGGLHLVNLPAVGYPFAEKQPIGYARFAATPGGASLTLKAIGSDRAKDGEVWGLDWRAG